jgi:hypothetical protein
MTRLDWDRTGERFFEAGADRGVLFIGDNAGVPWNGLVGFSHNQSGGESSPRYLDGVKISNRTTPEEFEGTLEAYTYPTEFERCDGTARADNGLRITKQRRKPFSMVYRTKIGDDLEGIDSGYKLHFLYNLTAEPSDRSYKSLSDQVEPLTFNWKITSRGVAVSGYRPTAHFYIDSRDIPSGLLSDLEDIIYGTDTTDSSLPAPDELFFMFDSYSDTVYDAGSPLTPVFVTYDAGGPTTAVDAIIDGGTA